MKIMGKPTVNWPEDEENDSCGPKEARWRLKTKNRAECTSVVTKANDSSGLQHLGVHTQLLHCVIPTIISWYTIRIPPALTLCNILL